MPRTGLSQVALKKSAERRRRFMEQLQEEAVLFRQIGFANSIADLAQPLVHSRHNVRVFARQRFRELRDKEVL